jgi:hypothetical protein
MKLKASHFWATDGTVIIQVRDHDATTDMKDPTVNKYAGHAPWARRKPQIATLKYSMTVPRGTTKSAIKLAKKTAIMLCEVIENEVSR